MMKFRAVSLSVLCFLQFAAFPYARELRHLPAHLGSWTDVKRPKRAPSTVFILEDVHQNKTAQQKLARAAAFLIRKKLANQIFVEGSSGLLPLAESVDGLEPDDRKVAADYLFDQGKIQAGVYAALTESFGTPVFGTEDISLYNANIKAVREAAQWRSQADRFLSIKRRQHLRHSERISPEAVRLDAVMDRHHQGSIDHGETAFALQSISPNAVEPLHPFLNLLRQEKRIDFARVEQIRNQLASRLIPRLSRKEQIDLRDMAHRIRTGDPSALAFHERFFLLAEREGLIGFKEAPFVAYINYLRSANEVNIRQFFVNLERCEKKAWDDVARTKEDKQFLLNGALLRSHEKLASFSLTRQQWEARKKLLAQFESEEAFFPGIEIFSSFYETALLRDEAMANNMIRKLTRSKNKSAVVISGGFHSNGLKKKLEDAGFNIVVFTPRFEIIPGTKGNDYLTLFVQSKPALEALFSGERLFLAMPAWSKSIASWIGLSGGAHRFLKEGKQLPARQPPSTQPTSRFLFKWGQSVWAWVSAGAAASLVLVTFASPAAAGTRIISISEIASSLDLIQMGFFNQSVVTVNVLILVTMIIATLLILYRSTHLTPELVEKSRSTRKGRFFSNSIVFIIFVAYMALSLLYSAYNRIVIDTFSAFRLVVGMFHYVLAVQAAGLIIQTIYGKYGRQDLKEQMAFTLLFPIAFYFLAAEWLIPALLPWNFMVVLGGMEIPFQALLRTVVLKLILTPLLIGPAAYYFIEKVKNMNKPNEQIIEEAPDRIFLTVLPDMVIWTLAYGGAFIAILFNPTLAYIVFGVAELAWALFLAHFFLVVLPSKLKEDRVKTAPKTNAGRFFAFVRRYTLDPYLGFFKWIYKRPFYGNVLLSTVFWIYGLTAVRLLSLFMAPPFLMSIAIVVLTYYWWWGLKRGGHWLPMFGSKPFDWKIEIPRIIRQLAFGARLLHEAGHLLFGWLAFLPAYYSREGKKAIIGATREGIGGRLARGEPLTRLDRIRIAWMSWGGAIVNAAALAFLSVYLFTNAFYTVGDILLFVLLIANTAALVLLVMDRSKDADWRKWNPFSPFDENVDYRSHAFPLGDSAIVLPPVQPLNAGRIREPSPASRRSFEIPMDVDGGLKQKWQTYRRALAST